MIRRLFRFVILFFGVLLFCSAVLIEFDFFEVVITEEARRLVLLAVSVFLVFYSVNYFRQLSLDGDSLIDGFEEYREASLSSEGSEIDLDYNDDVEELREGVFELVKDCLIQRHGLDEEEAVKVVWSGNWSNDDVANAFVAGGEFPVLERLRSWLEEEDTVDRRLDRTLESIETICGGEK